MWFVESSRYFRNLSKEEILTAGLLPLPSIDAYNESSNDTIAQGSTEISLSGLNTLTNTNNLASV